MTETLFFTSEIFGPSGLLAKSLPSYEQREGQQEMAQKIWEAFETNQTALFEAGTGIGKSLAYLIPALLWSFQTKEKVVISTYTIALQEQLIEKDLPYLLDILGIDVRVVLAKGMGNYVCKNKVETLSKQHHLYDDSLDAVISWSEKSKEGCKSSLPFSIPSESWQKVYAEAEDCAYVKCPHYRQCFFFKARSKMDTADVIIVNHHLLMAHLFAEEGKEILPPFSRLIVDEAHHLEQVTRSAMTKAIDRIGLFKTLARVHSDIHPEISRLFFIRDRVKDKGMKIRLDIDLPQEKRNLITKIHSAFDQLELLYKENFLGKTRVTEQTLLQNHWKEKATPLFLELKTSLEKYALSLESIEKEIDTDTKPKVEAALVDILQVVKQLKEVASAIEAFFHQDDVRWIEKTSQGFLLSFSALSIASHLHDHLFASLKTTILCSATLALQDNFTHIKDALGIHTKAIEGIYPSPFDFKEQARLLGIKGLSSPSNVGFIKEASEIIRQSVAISQGGAFVLFTSYDMLQKCAKQLFDLPLLKQGDLPRHQLLEEFKNHQNAVLFGTDSFWEGVDVVGQALRLVIIVKLPFPVPTDPLLEALSEQMRSEGKDPFLNASIPPAVVKFKQGFGRLMRHKEDRGCVLCLDERLFTKAYGKIFLENLPECRVFYEDKSLIYNEMRRFYHYGA